MTVDEDQWSPLIIWAAAHLLIAEVWSSVDYFWIGNVLADGSIQDDWGIADGNHFGEGIADTRYGRGIADADTRFSWHIADIRFG